jgi:hypothetical protein
MKAPWKDFQGAFFVLFKLFEISGKRCYIKIESVEKVPQVVSECIF